MKLNWGTSIVIAIALFMMLMIYMVYRSFQLDHELVSEDYYLEEIQYQEVIDKKRRTATLVNNITWSVTDGGLLIRYPNEMDEITGTINLLKPDDQSMDLNLPITIEQGVQLIDRSSLNSGKYYLTIDWQSDANAYLTEGQVFIP